ncbi:MAG: hypothetical protein ABSE77_10525 [Acidimicrobiales bacterium]
MSLPWPQPPGHNVQPLSDEHLRVMGSIVTALGHLDLALLRTVRDLVPGADGPSVEALLAGDTTPQLAAKFDRLVKQHHPDEPICAQVVSWCVAVNEVWGRWNQEIHASWVGDQPDESLKRVRYTKTAYRGGLPVEQTGLDDLRRIADDVADRMAELKAMGARLNLRGDQDP